MIGRKALGYFSFRNWAITRSWVGISERPTYENAQEVADSLVEAFVAGADDDGDDPVPTASLG